MSEKSKKENNSQQNSIMERWQFGVDHERLLNLVLSGKKKATCYIYNKNDKLAKVGDLSIITTIDGKDACVIQTEEVVVLPFNEMNWDFAKFEGETNSLEEWVKIHNEFFKTQYKDFKQDTLIVFEKFKLKKKIKQKNH